MTCFLAKVSLDRVTEFLQKTELDSFTGTDNPSQGDIPTTIERDDELFTGMNYYFFDKITMKIFMTLLRQAQ